MTERRWQQPAEEPPPRAGRRAAPGLDDLLTAVARGDERAYDAVYDLISGWVLGVARKVIRDPGLAEEVMQEVMLEVWRLASRFDPAKGSGTSWVMTLAHRRAVDRVRSERSHATRELRAATAVIDYDDVTEAVEASVEAERVQRCLSSLTTLQRECVSLAYYGGPAWLRYRQEAKETMAPYMFGKTADLTR